MRNMHDYFLTILCTRLKNFFNYSHTFQHKFGFLIILVFLPQYKKIHSFFVPLVYISANAALYFKIWLVGCFFFFED